MSILHARILAQESIEPMGHAHPATAPGTPMTSPAAAIEYDPATWTVTYADLHPLYVAGGGPGHPPIAGNGPDIWAHPVPAGRP